MAFNTSIFDQQEVLLPDLSPAEEAPSFNFEADIRLPDPMDLVRQGALIAVSHSGGKDGQAMLIHLMQRLQVPREQVVVIHASLDDAEWEGTAEHAKANADEYGLPFLVCEAHDAAGNTKNLLDYVDKRGRFMSSSQRYCTSDWKRGPIRRTINAYREQINHQSPYVLNCMGMRAAESTERAKLTPLMFVKGASCPSQPFPKIIDAETRARRRIFFDWHPVLHYTEEQIFATIAAAGQQPHWAYTKAGARRLSCLICLYSTESDIRAAVTHSKKGRAYARRIIALEEKHDHTILPLRSAGKSKPPEKRWIRDIVGDLLESA